MSDDKTTTERVLEQVNRDLEAENDQMRRSLEALQRSLDVLTKTSQAPQEISNKISSMLTPYLSHISAGSQNHAQVAGMLSQIKQVLVDQGARADAYRAKAERRSQHVVRLQITSATNTTTIVCACSDVFDGPTAVAAKAYAEHFQETR